VAILFVTIPQQKGPPSGTCTVSGIVRSSSTQPVPTLVSGAIVSVTGAVPGGTVTATSQQGYYAASWACSTQVYVALTVDLSSATGPCKGLNPTPPGATGNYKSVAPNTPVTFDFVIPGC
jgi:hypothetical protein